MALTNPALVLPPTNGRVTKIVASTTSTGTTGEVTEGWYSFRAVDATCYVEFGVTGLSVGAASTLWEIPAGQREDYYIPKGLTRVKVVASASGSLKFRKSGG